MQSNKRHQQGLALIIVLWMLALLSIIALSYSHMNRVETLLTKNTIATAKARALAKAGVQLGIYDLLKSPTDRQYPLDGRNFSASSGVQLSIIDETGKIDLNKASKELLISLFTYISADNEKAEALTDAVLDWRDRDNLKRVSGAESSDYRAAGLDYVPKDGFFNSIGEAAYVLGMNDALYQRLRPLITVHSMQSRVRLSSAPRNVLAALPGMTDDLVENIILTRSLEESNALAPLLPDSVRPYVFSAGNGNVFSITSEATIDGIIKRVRAIILMKRNGDKPITVLDWQENITK